MGMKNVSGKILFSKYGGKLRILFIYYSQVKDILYRVVVIFWFLNRGYVNNELLNKNSVHIRKNVTNMDS
jgi:hypothetical protein